MLSGSVEFEFPGSLSETSFRSYGKIDMNPEIFKTD